MQFLLAISFTFIALTAPAANADTIEIESARGVVSVTTSPTKIAVFDVAAIDTLAALGVQPDGVIERVYVDYLDEVIENAELVGDIFEPDFEAINALQPDLIIAGGRSAPQFDALSEFAPTIDMTIGSDVATEAISRLNAFGRIFNKVELAKELADGLGVKLARARKLVAGKGNALIILTNGSKISAYGPGGRFGWLHDALDLPPAKLGISTAIHGEPISFEFIREANPDYLIVVDRLAALRRSGSSAKETLDNELVHATKAWKNKKVIYLNATNVYVASGGYYSLNRTLDNIISVFMK